MTTGFFCTLDEALPGFEPAELSKRLLLRAPFVALVRDAEEVTGAFPAARERVSGVIVCRGTERRCERLTPRLWQLEVRAEDLPGLGNLCQPFLDSLLELQQETSNAERESAAHVHMRHDFDRAQQDYMSLTVNLRRQVEDLTRAHQEIKELNQTLEDRVRDRTRKLESANRALSVAKDAAEKANSSKSMFLATMSHEIRTPMNGVLGMLELAQDLEMSDELRRMLDTIRDSASALLSILNDILDFSKIEAGRMELERQPFSLRRLVSGVSETMQGSAKRRAVQLRHEIAREIPDSLLLDPTRVRQVLTNLCSNAIKFTSSRDGHPGEVVLSVTLPDGLPDSSQPCRVRIEVRDNGIGMTAEQCARVFNPFQQADVSTTRKYGGTGLGLSICRQLTNMMGGEIRVLSEQGFGTRFQVDLPLEQVDATPVRGIDGSDAEPVALRPAHLLVVEDNPVNQLVISGQLRKLGMTFDLVDDGLAALDALDAGTYDIVLTDCHMPNVDGYEFTARVRASERDAGRPRQTIIAVTASALQGETQQCFEAGMDDYIPKPIEISVLREKLGHWLRK